MLLCECGCGETPKTGRRFVRYHQVKLMQSRNRERNYSREHLEKLWAGKKGKPTWNRKPRGLISCACGCGNQIETPDTNGRDRRFINGHQTKTLVLKRKRPYGPSPSKGTKASLETRRKLSESHQGQEPWNKGLKGVSIGWNKGMKGVMSHTLETRNRISEKLRGSKSHLWRGGHERRCKRTTTVEWRFLRKQIYERDKWCCQVCKKPCANKIQCHHIVPVRYNGGDDPLNLATVCISCHGKQEKLFGKPEYFWADFVNQYKGLNA